MDDLISRQAAIAYSISGMTREIDGDKWIRVSEVRESIKTMPSAQPEWTPCSERLPDITDHHVSEPCLVYCDNGAYTFAALEENIFGQVGWNCERDDDYHEAVGVVVAWMPLPKPYKEEEE